MYTKFILLRKLCYSINSHQLFAMIGTLSVISLTNWRYRFPLHKITIIKYFIVSSIQICSYTCTFYILNILSYILSFCYHVL